MRSGMLLPHLFFCTVALSSGVATGEEPLPPPPPPSVGLEVEPVRLTQTRLLGKRPEIAGSFSAPIAPGSLTLLLDGADVTHVAAVEGTSFRFRPPLLLPSGDHTLTVIATDPEGRQTTSDLRFSSRHTPYFEDAYVSGAVSSQFETPLLEKPEGGSPDTKVESILQSDGKVKKGDFEASLAATLRQYYQNRPLPQFPGSPLQNGLTIPHYLLTARYGYAGGFLQGELGNIMVNETQNTVANLMRRGGRVTASFGGFTLSGFTVNGENLLGFSGGTGLNVDNSHISGVSGTLTLMEQKVTVKTVYARGGEPGTTLGTVGAGGGKEGDVVGINLLTDFWGNRFRTDFEFDRARFDPDTGDDSGKRSGNAWRFKAGGAIDAYNYEAGYEYLGRDYVSIGNLMQMKDRETFSARGGAFLGTHSVNLGLSRYHDNVADDPQLSRTTGLLGNMDYSYSGIQSLPLGLSYQKSRQRTGHQASGLSADTDTDAVNARLGYVRDRLNLNFAGGWSHLDDLTPGDRDTTTITLSLSPGYTLPQISITPTFSLNRMKQHSTGVWTDIVMGNLDVRSRFFKEHLTADGAVSYNVSRTDDHLSDIRTLSVQARIAFSLADLFKDYVRPSVALRGNYSRTDDLRTHVGDRESSSIFLVLSAAVPFML